MGDGVVNQTFTANVTDLENKLAQAERAQTKLLETLQKIRQESKQGNQEILGGLQTQTSELTGMVTKYATVAGAIEGVAKAYEKWDEQLKKIEESNKKVADSLARKLAQTGLLSHGAEIQKWTEQQVAKGFTREQAQAAMFGAAAGAPMAGFERQMGIARATLPAAILGTPEDLQKFAETTGRVGEFTGRKPGEVANLVEKLRTQIGPAKAEELMSRQFISGARGLVESGAATPEEALAMGAIMLKEELSPQMLEQMASKIAAPPEVAKTHGHLTAADAAKRQFHDAAPRERLKMLLEHPEMQHAVLGSRLEGRAARVSAADIAAEEGVLAAASRQDVIGKEAGQFQKFEAGRWAIAEQEHRQREDQSQIGKVGQNAYIWEEADKAVEEYIRRETEAGNIGPAKGSMMRFFYGLQKGITRMAADTDRMADPSITERALETAGFSEKEQKEFTREMLNHFRTGDATNAAQAQRANGRE